MTAPPGGVAAEQSALHVVSFRLAFGECDPAGIVYYATYLKWAERVHGEWWFLAGRPIGGSDPADLRPGFVVRHVACEYLSAPRPYDAVTCSMTLDAIGKTSFALAFEFASPVDSRRFAAMSLTAVFVDGAMRPVPVPEDARRLLEAGPSGSIRG